MFVELESVCDVSDTRLTDMDILGVDAFTDIYFKAP